MLSPGIHQIQGVAYIHDWSHPREGAFHFYPQGPGGDVVTVAANSSTATIIDGSVVQHGVDTFRPAAGTPPFTRHQRTRLKYESEAAGRGARWNLLADGEAVAAYAPDELRMSFVWRHMCFRSEAERTRYQTEELSLEDVLSKFEADLRRRGGFAGVKRPPPLDFARLIISTYVLYPPRRLANSEYNPWRLPYNPCVLAKAPFPLGAVAATICSAFTA